MRLRPFLTITMLLALTLPVMAQQQSFTLGGRYSSYSTDLSVGPVVIETGREGSFGINGAFRSGGFVLSGFYDRDSGGDLDLGFLPFDLADFDRSRFEATVGYSILPTFDIEGGVRLDKIEYGGVLFFNDEVKLDHQAITAGFTLRTPPDRPVSWYGTARGYIGTMDLDVVGVGVGEVDTTGYRVETGVRIRIGSSNWHVTPGLEWEVINADEDDSLLALAPDIELETNRLFLMFGYTWGGR
jgi:hypothetical protein